MNKDAKKIVDKINDAETADQVVSALKKKFAEIKTVAGFGWGDVQGCAESELGIELDREQCLAVLDLCERRFDANLGLDWDIIEMRIEEYLQENGGGQEKG